MIPQGFRVFKVSHLKTMDDALSCSSGSFFLDFIVNLTTNFTITISSRIKVEEDLRSIMDNSSLKEQNDRVRDEMMKTITVSSFGIFGGFGTILSLLLICFQLIGFKKRKAYEYIIFAVALANFINSITKCSFHAFVVVNHNDYLCKYCGLLIVIVSCSTTMLLTVNMLHRYLSLYHPAIAKKISTNRGVILCTVLPVLANIAYYSPLQLVDAFGWDAIGTCSMKAFSAPKNMWITLCGVELFSCNIVNVVLALLVICKIRAHSNQVQNHFKSHFLKESKQIVKIIVSLTVCLMGNNILGVVIRLLPPETITSLWINRISIIINSSFVAMVPIITIMTIKHYRKNLIHAFKCAANQVTIVEPIHLNTMKKSGTN